MVPNQSKPDNQPDDRNPNCDQSPRIYVLSPPNFTKLNNKKFTIFHHLEVDKLYPESITYSVKSCVDLFVARIISNGKLGQSSNISFVILKSNKKDEILDIKDCF